MPTQCGVKYHEHGLGLQSTKADCRILDSACPLCWSNSSDAASSHGRCALLEGRRAEDRRQRHIRETGGPYRVALTLMQRKSSKSTDVQRTSPRRSWARAGSRAITLYNLTLACVVNQSFRLAILPRGSVCRRLLFHCCARSSRNENKLRSECCTAC